MYRNPHEEASEDIKRRGEAFGNAVSTVGGIAAGGTLVGSLGGSAIAKKVLPLLSKYIPQNLMLKGLSKIDTRLGKFAENAMRAGNDVEEVRDFIGDKFKPPEPPKDDRNIIQQYSPELFQFLEKEVGSGRPVLEAGAIAETSGKFKSAIQKMIKDHKTPFSNILQSVFGGQGEAQPQQQQQQQSQQMQQPQASQQQAQGGGQGKQSLMTARQAARNRKK
jgi:hypothetical protein